MAELNIRVNTQQAAVGAKAFEKMINDIKAAARSLDQMNMTQFGGALRSLTSSGANLLAMVNQIADALGRMNYSLQSIRAADYGSKLAGDFSKVRDMIRETRAELAGLNTGLREAVTLAGRMGTASQRVRRARAPAAAAAAEGTAAGDAAETATAAATVMSTALVPATTRAVAVFQSFAPVASSITLVTTAVSGLAREMKLLSSGAESADRSMRQLVTTTQRAHAAVQQFRVSPTGETARLGTEFYGVGRPPRQLGPGGMGEAGAMVPYQRPPSEPIITPQPGAGIVPIRRRGVEAEILQGEIVDRYGKALMNVQQPLMATSKAVENTGEAMKRTKEHKDRLDRNLKDTAQNTLPQFNKAWLATIGVMALFQVRRILSELTDLGKSLFQTGVEFEKAFALMKAGAGDSAEEGARRMQVMSDLARRLGLDLPQLAIDYGKVMAAAKGSDIEGRQAEEMVKNLASAMAVLGQNTEKGSGLIKVFTDVLSKGRLQSEELVKQLGNAVPAAFRVVATSVGMTTTELQDAVAKGSISATQTLVKLAAEINKIYGAQAAENLNRLGGAFNGLKQSITEVSLLIVNMATGISTGSGGTFGQTLVRTFKELSELLQRRDIQQRIVELANFITNILSKAFNGLIAVLQFVTENMKDFLFVLTVLTSAAIITAVTSLALALRGLVTTLVLFGATGVGKIVAVVGLIASAVAGYFVVDQFTKSIEGVGAAMDKAFADEEKRRQQQAQGNQNPGDQTRAVQQALNRVEAEQRRFVEGVRQEAQLLELAASGVSTLSAKYEAYLNVLERIKAQEVKELFDILKPGDAATMKRRLTEALLQAELVKQAVSDIVEMFKSLDQAQEQFATQAGTAVETLKTMQAGSFTELGSRIQEQYDQKVIPVMRRVREEMRSIADPNLRNTLVGAFNAWSAAMRDNIVHIEKLKDQMSAVTDLTKQLRDFRFAAMTADMLGAVRDGKVFVDTTLDDISGTIDTMRKEGFFPDLQPPKIRTLGEEMKEGFNPVDVGKEMGKSFTDIFVVAMEASVQKLIDQMKTMADVTRSATYGGTGGPALEAAGPYKELFIKGGEQYNVDPELAARFARAESGFRPGVVAKDAQGNVIAGGGRGMMQFIPSTQRKLGLSDADIFDPAKNVMAGNKLIDQLLTEHKGVLEKVVEGYRGRSRAEDPEYYKKILGDYTGTGRMPAGGAGTSEIAQAAKAAEAQRAAQTPAATPTAEAKQPGIWDRVWGALEASDRFQKRVFESVTGGGKSAAGDERFAADVDAARRARGEIIPNPQGYPEPIGPMPLAVLPETKEEIEARAKAKEEDAKRTMEQYEAIKKRTQAEQDAAAAGDKVRKETEARQAKEREEMAKAQAELDKRTAQLSKEIELMTTLGTVEMSEASMQARLAAAAQNAYRFKQQYNAATDEQIKQAAILGAAQFTKDAIKQGNDYALSLEKQTKALNDETDALIRNRHESSLTAEASTAERQRERDRLEGGRAFGPEEEARRAQASRDLTTAQVRSNVEGYLSNSEKERRSLQMEIDLYKDNTSVRAINLQSRRDLDEQLRNSAGMSDEQKRRIMESNEALRQTKITLQQANGPMRQYIDSLADFSDQTSISHAMQERSAELFKSLEDNIINFTKTGKLNFRELADSFIDSIIRMTLQALIFRPIAEALNRALSGGTGSGPAPATDVGGGAPGWFGWLQAIVKIGGMVGGAAGAGTTPMVAGTTGRTLDIPQIAGVAARTVGASGGWVTPWGIQHFQGGGMARVGTDTVPAMLTPGEMVLNKEQQANVFGKKDGQQNNTFNMVFPNVSNEDQARKTAAQAYSEISSRLERQRVRDGIRTRR